MRHRATGNLRGRPISVGANIGARIIEALLPMSLAPLTQIVIIEWLKG